VTDIRDRERQGDAGEGFTWDDGPAISGGAGVRSPAESRAARGEHDRRAPLGTRPGKRRRATAGAALAAMLLGFFGAGLLDAANLKRDAQGMTLGPRRSIAVALISPMAALSRGIGLDRPGRAVDSALGRSGAHHTLAQAKTSKPLWPRPVTPARPLTLYIAGDSMAQVFGESLVNLSADTGIVEPTLDYHISTGLSRPDFYDWPQRLIDMLVEVKPDAVVALFGANDAQDVSYQGRVLKLGTAAWRSLYRQRVAAAMGLLTQSGRRVYWVGDPIMRDKVYSGRIAMMDRIYAAEARLHPGVTYIDTWALMARNGAFAATLPGDGGQPVMMRNADGIHLSRAGGDRMAGAVLRVIAKDWGFKL
jgi:uncharacterized protein